MKAYYQNQLKKENISSIHTSPLSSTDNLLHRFLGFPWEASVTDYAVIDIFASITFNTVLLAISNAERIVVELYRSNVIISSTEITNIEYIMRIAVGETQIDRATIRLYGNNVDLIQLGAVYFGNYVLLPRFIAEPRLGKEFPTEADRSFGGVAYGLDSEELRTVSLQFRRISLLDYKKTYDYLSVVGKTIPHFVDIYEEANDAWPIMYCTFDGDFETTKRNENGFWFNYSMEYKEAK